MSGTPPHHRKWVKRFGRLLHDERESAKLTIEDCPKGGSYQKECESKSVPALQYLVRILMWFRYKRGYEIPPERLRRLLIIWALARIETYLETKKFREQVEEDGYKDETGTRGLKFDEIWIKYGEKVLTHIENTLFPVFEGLAAEKRPSAAPIPTGKLPTLAMFPDAFKPLIVVVGGYPGDAPKEPEQLSELFRHGQSFVDLSFLPRLGLGEDVRIVPDHLFLEMDIEERTKKLGSAHLLLIGGPLVNSLTRYLILKKKLIFNYVYGRDTYRWDQVYDRFRETGLFDNPAAVRMLYRMLETPQGKIDVRLEPFADTGVSLDKRRRIEETVLEIRRDLLGDLEANSDDVTEQFRPREIFSPFKPKLLSFVSDEQHEQAIITLGENPWARELNASDPENPLYTVTAAFGYGEVATAQAVKALSKTAEVRGRPLGGVLSVTVARALGWDRIERSPYKWETDPYNVQALLVRLSHAQGSAVEQGSAFSIFTDDEMTDYKRLAELFQY